MTNVDDTYVAMIEASNRVLTKTLRASLEVLYNWTRSTETLPDGRIVAIIGRKPEDKIAAERMLKTFYRALVSEAAV